MAAIHLYCDERAKFQVNDYTSFCGYIHRSDVWEKISNEWNDISREYSVPAIHMRYTMRPDQDAEWSAVKQRWGDAWESKKEALLARLFLKITLSIAGSEVTKVLPLREKARTPGERGGQPETNGKRPHSEWTPRAPV